MYNIIGDQVEFENAIAGVGDMTIYNLMPLWLENLRENFELIVNGKSVQEVQKVGRGKKAIIIGRGPSLRKHNHLELLARNRPSETFVICSDGALPLCIEAGIRPYAGVTVDGNREKIWKWYNHDLDGTKAILPVTCAKNVAQTAERNGAEVLWYVPVLDVEEKQPKVSLTWVIDRMLSRDWSRPIPILNNGGNAGMCGWCFAADALEVSEIALIGMDLGYGLDTKLDETHYHEGMKASLKDDAKLANMYKLYENTFVNEVAVVDPVFEIYRRMALKLIESGKERGVTTTNCTEGGSLFGQGLEQMKFSEWLAK